jgi:hypothetical protein
VTGEGKSSLDDRELERVRIERLRADAQRSMSENLRDGIELSHKLLAFVGVARKQ